jgi:uncharacterized membrane protein YphA (DoxX/SURF4 family)
MIWSSILVFCRVAIGLVFLLSSGSKVRNVSQFQQTITRFRLLPERLSPVISLVGIVAEMTVVLLLVVGGRLLLIGFLLATILLLIFCAALASVLARSIQTSCNCFGTSEKPVTKADIYRNITFILCSLIGFVLITQVMRSEQIEPGMWLLSGVMAAIAVMTTLSLDDIMQLFRSN